MRFANAFIAFAVSAGLATTPVVASAKSSTAAAVASAPALGSASGLRNLRAGTKIHKSEKEIDQGAAIALGVVAAGILVWCVADFCKGGGSN